MRFVISRVFCCRMEFWDFQFNLLHRALFYAPQSREDSRSSDFKLRLRQLIARVLSKKQRAWSVAQWHKSANKNSFQTLIDGKNKLFFDFRSRERNDEAL